MLMQHISVNQSNRNYTPFIKYLIKVLLTAININYITQSIIKQTIIFLRFFQINDI